MCHGAESHPPIPPGAGDLVQGRKIELEASDGNRFAAYATRAKQSSGDVGILILPDVRGLHQFYCQLAGAFSAIGYDAVAIDYYGRTAGVSNRSEDFVFRPHFDQSTPQEVADDCRAAVDFLESPDGGGVSSIVSVGFCFGGSNSWRLSAELPELAGAVGFYGHPHRAADVIAQMRAPLLIFGGGQDPGIPPNDLHEMARQVRSAGVDADVVIYEDAKHSFFDRNAMDNRDICADAWRRILEFINPRQPDEFVTPNEPVLI